MNYLTQSSVSIFDNRMYKLLKNNEIQRKSIVCGGNTLEN